MAERTRVRLCRSIEGGLPVDRRQRSTKPASFSTVRTAVPTMIPAVICIVIVVVVVMVEGEAVEEGAVEEGAVEEAVNA